MRTLLSFCVSRYVLVQTCKQTCTKWICVLHLVLCSDFLAGISLTSDCTGMLQHILRPLARAELFSFCVRLSHSISPSYPTGETNNSRLTKAALPKGLPDIHGWSSQRSPLELFLVITQHLTVKKCVSYVL